MKMKLDPVYPEIVKRFQDVKTNRADAWKKWVDNVVTAHKYNDLLTRLSWDLLRCVFHTQDICDWYREYNVNDKHITTVVKKAYVEVFGMPTE